MRLRLPDPMLSSRASASGSGSSFELKWDGFRAIVSTEDGLAVRSRRGWNMTPGLPELRALPARFVLWAGWTVFCGGARNLRCPGVALRRWLGREIRLNGTPKLKRVLRGARHLLEPSHRSPRWGRRRRIHLHPRRRLAGHARAARAASVSDFAEATSAVAYESEPSPTRRST